MARVSSYNLLVDLTMDKFTHGAAAPTGLEERIRVSA